jgi:hypothetical protein
MGAGIAVLGPALRPGSLLSLDLVLVPRIPVPAGVWGLGPDLPRRVPYGVVLAWGSRVLTGPAVGKVVLLLAIATAVVGAARLVEDEPAAVRLGAGLLYGLSPFVLTRVGAGHVGMVLAVAVLPWALPTLLRPGERVARTMLWSAALGVTGFAGGAFALLLIAIGLVADRGRRWGPVVAAALVGQLPWAVPGVVVAAADVRLNSSGRFATRVDGLAGVFGLPAGHGFWRASSQVGGDAGTGVAVIGLVLVVLALLGRSRLPVGWGARATVVAGVGAAVALASAVPGVRGLYEAWSATPLGAIGRESQRWLALFLVWMAPAAALGALRLAGVFRVVPVVCALVVAAPGLWGVGGRLEPVAFPEGWHAVRRHVAASPGPVLALPWHQYLDISFADGRRVLNPLADYLGGDVLVSSNPELGPQHREQADAREPMARRVADRAARGEVVAAQLRELGVRWVVLIHEVDWRRYRSIATDPGLDPALTSASIELFEVRGWRGPIVTDAGRRIPARSVVAPLARPPASPAATWNRSAAPGWMRGWHRARATSVGTLALPAGGGIVWFWPALLVLLGYMCTLCGVVRAWRACKLKERWYRQIDGG